MPVDGADIVETELLEQGPGRDHSLDVLFNSAGEIEHRRGNTQHLLARTSCGVVGRHQAGENLGQCAHRWRNRHLVVIEDDEEVEVFRIAGVVECLEGHAGRHRAVADDRDRLSILATIASRDGHPHGR